jgi:very-short-patch-repair endonuclease
VERPHKLPPGLRNQQERQADGRNRYRDVRYASYRLVVELEGREAHPAAEAFRDLRRDNAVVVGGETVLHYGWRDVAGNPCLVATQVALALTARGWPGPVRRCGPNCRIE